MGNVQIFRPDSFGFETKKGRKMSFWQEVIAIWIAVILADPIGILLGEWLKDLCSARFGWFKGYKAYTEMPGHVDKLLKKLAKKRGYKRRAKDALALIKEAKAEVKEQA